MPSGFPVTGLFTTTQILQCVAVLNDWRLLLSDSTVLLCDVIVRANICIVLERNIYKGVLMLQNPFNKIQICVFYYVFY